MLETPNKLCSSSHWFYVLWTELEHNRDVTVQSGFRLSILKDYMNRGHTPASWLWEQLCHTYNFFTPKRASGEFQLLSLRACSLGKVFQHIRHGTSIQETFFFYWTIDGQKTLGNTLLLSLSFTFLKFPVSLCHWDIFGYHSDGAHSGSRKLWGSQEEVPQHDVPC